MQESMQSVWSWDTNTSHIAVGLIYCVTRFNVNRITPLERSFNLVSIGMERDVKSGLQHRAGYDQQMSQVAELRRTIQEWWTGVHDLDDPPFSTRIVSLTAKVCAAVAICYVLETQAGKLSDVLPSIPPPKDN